MKHYHQLPSGHRMYYEIRGNTDSKHPPFVFLNGLSQSTQAWLGVIQKDFGEEFTCILIDLIFQGESDSADQFKTFEEHAEDLHDLLSKLAYPTYHLAGISYGGAVAQRFIVDYPEKISQAYLISTFAAKNEYFNAIGLGWKKALLCGNYELMFDIMLPFVLGKSFFENPIISLETLKISKQHMSPATSDLLKLMEATEKSENYLMKLSHCKVPCIIIHGEEDILCTPEMGMEMAQHIPKNELIILPKVGHTLNLEAIDPLKNILALKAKAFENISGI
ncbi:alpha/beta fold hydrolase [Mongoliitalea daihaiensis]|uniref:alpha/beta fold hydrolase n=1 Tax=Mongoliitalea daihaiensis TaxID=2782006 RepID=UPI001F18A198|nr:alpha/beta hydrolase [Mongoliitalea daihaiensis]UJP64565.1 alpha/beta hydrolase [Mongoliitalea daihaiensis]